MTVVTILIAAVLPLASAQAQREREAELIFRGTPVRRGDPGLPPALRTLPERR